MIFRIMFFMDENPTLVFASSISCFFFYQPWSVWIETILPPPEVGDLFNMDEFIISVEVCWEGNYGTD